MSSLRTTEAFDEAIEDLAEQTREAREPIAVSEADEALRSSVVEALGSKLPRAVVLRVPAALDQLERVACDIGAQVGPGAAAAIDEHLQTRPENISELLEQCLEDRPLIVDGRNLVGNLGSGTDPAMRHALSEQLESLARLMDRRASCVLTPGRPKQAFAAGHAPFTSDELGDPARIWQYADCQTEVYVLLLGVCALRGVPIEEASKAPAYVPEPDALRDEIDADLAEHEVALLDMLCAHARPLPREIVARRSLERAIDFGQQLRLWHADRSSVWVTRGWSTWWERARPEPYKLDWHRNLACWFRDEASQGVAERSGGHLLEALRHFTFAGDDEQAKRCARYGVQSIVGRARDLSRQREYARSASLYQFVVDSATSSPPRLPVSDKLHAYSLHYLHYNRNRELTTGAPLAPTIEGYERALELWPQNAHFWSRLVRAYFYQDQPDAATKALAALARACKVVPGHHDKYTVLIARTVDGLIQRDKPDKYRLSAALVWARHEPQNHLERSTFRRLQVVLAEGWETSWLRIPGGPELVFHRPVRVQLEFIERKTKWIATFPELRKTAVDDGPREALTQLIEAVRETTRELVKALSHRLTASERLQKQVLISTIDIVASQLQAAVPEQAWVVGELAEGPEAILFRTTDGQLHPLAPELASTMLDHHPRLARFATDEVGRPVGPAVELSEPFRGEASELWSALRTRRTGG